MSKRGFFSRLVNYCNHVNPAGLVGNLFFVEVSLGNFPDLSLFALCYCEFGFSVFERLAVFNFHEYNCIAVFTNYVDFAVSVMIISVDNRHAFINQVIACDLFAQTSSLSFVDAAHRSASRFP